MLRVADGELRRVHADREPAGAGGEVVAGQGALAALVELRDAFSASGVAGMAMPFNNV